MNLFSVMFYPCFFLLVVSPLRGDASSSPSSLSSCDVAHSTEQASSGMGFLQTLKSLQSRFIFKTLPLEPIEQLGSNSLDQAAAEGHSEATDSAVQERIVERILHNESTESPVLGRRRNASESRASSSRSTNASESMALSSRSSDAPESTALSGGTSNASEGTPVAPLASLLEARTAEIHEGHPSAQTSLLHRRNGAGVLTSLLALLDVRAASAELLSEKLSSKAGPDRSKPVSKSHSKSEKADEKKGKSKSWNSRELGDASLAGVLVFMVVAKIMSWA